MSEQEIKNNRHVCDGFMQDDETSHRGEDENHTNQIFYELDEERCAARLTDEEFSMILVHDQIANSFSPIGETAKKWEEDEVYRQGICDRALELIKEKEDKEND